MRVDLGADWPRPADCTLDWVALRAAESAQVLEALWPEIDGWTVGSGRSVIARGDESLPKRLRATLARTREHLAYRNHPTLAADGDISMRSVDGAFRLSVNLRGIDEGDINGLSFWGEDLDRDRFVPAIEALLSIWPAYSAVAGHTNRLSNWQFDLYRVMHDDFPMLAWMTWVEESLGRIPEGTDAPVDVKPLGSGQLITLKTDLRDPDPVVVQAALEAVVLASGVPLLDEVESRWAARGEPGRGRELCLEEPSW